MNKILAIDLSFSEDISEYPTRYGGVGRSLYLLSQGIPNFYVVGGKGLVNCKNGIEINEEEQKELRKGNICVLSKYLDLKEFNLIFHASSDIHFYTDKKQLVWCVGQFETVHPLNTNILCHNYKNQQPKISNPDTEVYEFVLGVPIPEFQEYEKNDFIFQCSNQFPGICSLQLATLCNRYNIECRFAGPIAEGYPLLDYLDQRNTFYLGIISEEVKIQYLKRAKMFASLYGFPINSLSLALKQALSYNCGLLVTPIPALQKDIVNGFNGFFIQNEQDFVHAWNNRDKIKQRDCYDSVLKYSSENMINSFKKVIEKL